MDFIRINLMSDFLPLIFIHIAFFLESLLQVQRSQMTLYFPRPESLAQCRNNLTKAARLAGDVLGKCSHLIRQSPCLRSDEQHSRFFSLFYDRKY